MKDQVQNALRLAFGGKVDGPDGDDVTWLIERVDAWYQRCSTLNFLIAILLLITGGSTIDAKGQVPQQAAAPCTRSSPKPSPTSGAWLARGRSANCRAIGPQVTPIAEI